MIMVICYIIALYTRYLKNVARYTLISNKWKYLIDESTKKTIEF